MELQYLITARFVRFLSSCIIYLLFSCQHSVNSNIIYVSPSGNDSCDGTSTGQALASITRAAQLAQPGDQIQILGGIYELRNEIIISCKGTSEAPIRFLPYNQDLPVLDFSYLKENGNRSFAVLFPDSSCFVIFEGVELRNGNSGIRMTHCSNITIRNCRIYDFSYVAISVASDECLVENNEIYRICMAYENFNDLTGGWPQVVNTSAKPPIEPAIVRSQPMNNIFRANHIYDSWGEGIDPMFADGVLIENNIIHDVFSVGIYMDGTRNAVVRNNYIYTTGDTRIRNDIGRIMTGIEMGSEYFGGWSDYPAISHVENIYIYNNILSRIGTGVEHWIDRNNTDRKNIYENVKIFNNTIDTYNGTGDGIRFATDLKVSTRGNECRNNIFRSSRNCQAEMDFIFENNLWINGIPLERNHVNSITGEPAWLYPAPGGDVQGYTPAENSICEGKGQPIKGLTTDYFGKKRNSIMTLGAIETATKIKATPGKFVSSVEDVFRQTPPGFKVGVNIAMNPDFDDVMNNFPAKWTVDGDSASFSFFSPGHITRIKAESGISDNLVSEKCLKLGDKDHCRIYLYQTLTDIPDGRYGFHVRIKRFGESGEMYAEIAGYGGEPIRCSMPYAKDLNEWSDYSKSFFQLNISDIKVLNNSCTIGFFVSGNKGDYTLIDDVVFYRY